MAFFSKELVSVLALCIAMSGPFILFGCGGETIMEKCQPTGSKCGTSFSDTCCSTDSCIGANRGADQYWLDCTNIPWQDAQGAPLKVSSGSISVTYDGANYMPGCFAGMENRTIDLRLNQNGTAQTEFKSLDEIKTAWKAEGRKNEVEIAAYTPGICVPINGVVTKCDATVNDDCSLQKTLGAGYYCQDGDCVFSSCNVSEDQTWCDYGRGATDFCCPKGLSCGYDLSDNTNSSSTIDLRVCLTTGYGIGDSCRCPNGYSKVVDTTIGCKCAFTQCSDADTCQPSDGHPPSCCLGGSNTSATKPSSCAAGTGVCVNSLAEPCGNDGSLCPTPNCDMTKCETCNSVTGKQCDKCKEGYTPYYGDCNECIGAGEGCNTCSSDANPTCTGCSDGYYLDASDSTCKKCSGFNAACNACATSGVCTTCASGYFASTEAEVTAGKAACQACNTGCEICSPDAGTCTTCMYGADGTRMTAVTTGTGAGSCTSGTGFLQIEEM